MGNKVSPRKRRGRSENLERLFISDRVGNRRDRVTRFVGLQTGRIGRLHAASTCHMRMDGIEWQRGTGHGE